MSKTVGGYCEVVAHNCHIKTKCSHQIQIARSKFKSLSKLQIAPIKLKSFTSNTNRSHQIQIRSQQTPITVSVRRGLGTAD